MNYIEFYIMQLKNTFQIMQNSLRIIWPTFKHISNHVVNLNETYPRIITYMKSIYNICLAIFYGTFLRLLTIFQLFITLRIIMTWFPNFNSRNRPFLYITKLTKIYLGIFANLCPKFFGIDISAILAFVWLRTLIKICS
jgi:YggT family protein